MRITLEIPDNKVAEYCLAHAPIRTPGGEEAVRDFTPADLRELIRRIAQSEIRNKLLEKKKRNLINQSDEALGIEVDVREIS